MSARDRRYWNPDMEGILNTPDMERLQLKKLRRHLERMYDLSPLYHARIKAAGVVPDKLRSLEEFRKRFPLLDKEQVRSIILEDFRGSVIETLARALGIKKDEIVLISATSGTTGEPTPYLFTLEDLRVQLESLGRSLWRCGVRPGDVVMHAFALSLFIGGVPLVEAVQNLGAAAVPVGAEGGTERVLLFSQLFGAGTLLCTPSFAEHLAERAPQVIGREVGELGFERIISGGEPGAGLPEVRAKIEETFGATLYDHMGSGPAVWVSCDQPDYKGMHYVTDDLAIIEFIDPETREPMEMGEGALGEIVLTPLEGRGFGVPRFAMGDIAEVYTSPCPCGQTGFRYHVIGRVDDMLKVKGILVYPSAIDDVIASFMPRVTGEFRILLEEPPPRVKPPLRLKVERGREEPVEGLEPLGTEIAEAMHQRLRLRPQIEWLEPDTLERSLHKTDFFDRAYERA